MITKISENEYECRVTYEHRTITKTGSTQAIAWRACIEALKEVVGR